MKGSASLSPQKSTSGPNSHSLALGNPPTTHLPTPLPPVLFLKSLAIFIEDSQLASWYTTGHRNFKSGTRWHHAVKERSTQTCASLEPTFQTHNCDHAWVCLCHTHPHRDLEMPQPEIRRAGSWHLPAHSWERYGSGWFSLTYIPIFKGTSNLFSSTFQLSPGRWVWLCLSWLVHKSVQTHTP